MSLDRGCSPRRIERGGEPAVARHGGLHRGPHVTGTPACLRSSVLQFVASCSLPEFGPGRYRYSLACSEPTLYSSSYAAMAQSLLRALGGADTVEWAAYLNSFQDDDGLFRDPLSYGQGWYADDPLWCGRSHLTCHVLTALACLGAVAAEPLTWLEPWRNCDALVDWLEGLDWGARVGWTGNEIMNVGTLLQYARDFHNDARAGQAMECLLDSLEQHHLNPESGVWGSLDLTDPLQRSHAVQAAYHWWPLFAYDRRPFPHVDRAVDTVLATQNPRGGFGWGVHNPAEPFGSSACEDIDSIDPLARMLSQTDHRRDEVRAALRRGGEWVLRNQQPDGGFVFCLGRAFEYGHPQLRGEAGQGAMFPTWFRLLSLALVGRALLDSPLGQLSWQFVNCPGMQF
ncbi:MAG: hypothetical protein COZ06_38765 [Armatimonadetes bacterium CG_4_10_14_3_um_filter_66_18]|nr:hypothetical protein [Armatimonadota bacterium]PIU92080.1 MAG: hypothetical protein COS65_19680 [Armatimonadetes bacterium CG06_land_8_20_14_3_00_66_21]PIY35124.1 MAG: hypothetical protein COZ06_38765 [Armatimonadetes bacterium CG_4_10_14_3_um_filter_66_18]PIZ35612.1 MAG: hypothetical protein COY42_26470 [Armatimonadetes bacterium CG_4_10_14_0_8_um_filter_66_14]PJB61222.1 MAG: hypothetical protein CO096_29900 [Armatimonadetes bacterium CG_4_9_14_3_um_filter_66_14]